MLTKTFKKYEFPKCRTNRHIYAYTISILVILPDLSALYMVILELVRMLVSVSDQGLQAYA